jgi:hypothetical protein
MPAAGSQCGSLPPLGNAMARKLGLVLALLVAAVAIYAIFPRKADLRSFDPGGMARLEAAMWRDYYEKHYPKLFYHLYESSRREFGFSPLTSFRIALSAAQAAKAFQPTRSRLEADRALPYLVTYYGLLRSAAPAPFDVEEIARRELDWWQARREAVGPRDYGVTIAAVAALTYGKAADNPNIVQFGMGRAEAMAYRDARGERISDDDWSEIEAQLRSAYQPLKAGIGG